MILAFALNIVSIVSMVLAARTRFWQLLSPVMAIAAVLQFQAAGASALPPRVSSDELDRNKISGQDRFRIKGLAVGPFSALRVGVEVDETGNVAVVEPGDDFEQNGVDPDAAKAAVKEWKFRPFFRDGVATRVRSEVSVFYLPEERWKNRAASFPDVDFDDLHISLQRTACYGSCPDYQVEIDGKGMVRFTTEPKFISPDASVHRRYSGTNTLIAGRHVHQVDRKLVQDLVTKFRDAAYFGLEDQYVYQITDSPTYVLSFATGGKSKRVIDYVGIPAGMPGVVRMLEMEIDRIADTSRWVVGNDHTVAALEAEGFDFQSEDASQILLAAISRSPEIVPLGLLDKGASLRGNVPFALSGAIRSGKRAVFERLLSPGGLASLSQAQLDGLLFDASHSRNPALVKMLLDKGANSRAFVGGRGSPLIQALNDLYEPHLADEDQMGVIKLLLAAGSDLDARDGIGWSALQHAYDDDPKIVQLLLENGANINASGADTISYAKRQDTLLFLTDNEAIAMFAIGAGARLDLTDMEGRKIREIATEKGWSKVLKLLSPASEPNH